MAAPLVLIVDDNPENLSVIGELLLPQHAVRVANGGQRALQMARLAPRPDLVLLDVMMPGMDGFAVLRALRSDPLTSDIPVLLLTALDSAEDEARGLQLGAADYITKPVHPGVLLARVALQLAQRATVRQLRAEQQQLALALQQSQTDLQAMHDLRLHSLQRLLLQRFPETERHLARLQAHLRSLCQALRLHPRYGRLLDDRQVDQLLQASTLHDIGLLAVPDHVLDKPGPLDAAERALMQRHVPVGVEALTRDGPQAPPWLALAQALAGHHHERWDGRGYPGALSGEAIPWPARLLSLVDTYDGLTSARPDRPALTHADASALIASERGRQFDPDVADAFLDCCSDWPLMARRHA